MKLWKRYNRQHNVAMTPWFDIREKNEKDSKDQTNFMLHCVAHILEYYGNNQAARQVLELADAEWEDEPCALNEDNTGGSATTPTPPPTSTSTTSSTPTTPSSTTPATEKD